MPFSIFSHEVLIDPVVKALSGFVLFLGSVGVPVILLDSLLSLTVECEPVDGKDSKDEQSEPEDDGDVTRDLDVKEASS